jgi:DNA-binding response OmpR family regulator
MSDQGSILVVDDDLHVSEMLEELLIELGYSVDVARTGDEGFRRAVTKRPDAVILDVSLPDTTGEQVLAKLRSHDESLPVIMLSGHTDEDIAHRAVAAGAIGYLHKPFDFDVLCRTLSEAVAAGRHADAECVTR